LGEISLEAIRLDLGDPLGEADLVAVPVVFFFGAAFFFPSFSSIDVGVQLWSQKQVNFAGDIPLSIFSLDRIRNSYILKKRHRIVFCHVLYLSVYNKLTRVSFHV
jgi:hypothetical protein